MGRVYLDWAVFPYVRELGLAGQTADHLVEFQDLRYTYPSSRGAPLGGYVLLSPELKVLEQGMNSSRSARVDALEHGESGQ